MSQTGESKYEQVFGDTFALYNRTDMDQFIEPFRIRFERNGLDPKRLFARKTCLDAGCGNGRGTLFMLMHGAARVEALDYSHKNVETTTSFMGTYGFSNARVQQGTLEAIPFPDQSFDFVWCNGVIMHTAKPNRCLAEIARVLKTDGQAWLYVYGSGGIYWRVIYHLRKTVKSVPVDEAIRLLKILRYETRYVAEFIDDWYASFLRTYTHLDLANRAEGVGFCKPEAPLRWGMDYDSSHRRSSAQSGSEKHLMGEGDLRYLLTKSNARPKTNDALSEDDRGSDYHWPSNVTEAVDPFFEQLEPILGGRSWLRIAASAKLQRELRILLSEPGPFQLDKLNAVFSELVSDSAHLKSL